MGARLAAFLIWAAVAASAAFWAAKVLVTPTPVPAGTLLADGEQAVEPKLARLFGRSATPARTADHAPPPAPSRFQLVGVVAPRHAGDQAVAVALIAVDDQPAKAYRVGAVIDGGTTLQEVRARGVSLGPRDGPSMSLELPPLAAAATATLPPARSGAAAGLHAGTPPSPALVRPLPAQAPVHVPLPADGGDEVAPAPADVVDPAPPVPAGYVPDAEARDAGLATPPPPRALQPGTLTR